MIGEPDWDQIETEADIIADMRQRLPEEYERITAFARCWHLSFTTAMNVHTLRMLGQLALWLVIGRRPR